MNVAKFFYNLFHKPQQDVPKNQFAASVFPNGDIETVCGWTDYNEETAILYGQLLHKLTTGQLNTIILQSLSNYIQHNPNSVQFVKDIFDVWATLGSTNKDEPLIKPSDIFKASQ